MGSADASARARSLPSERREYTCEPRCQDHIAEITLSGELDLAARQRLDTALNAALDGESTQTLILDLSKVTVLDASVLHWLVSAKRRADAAGARLMVTTDQEPGFRRDTRRLDGRA